jgi:hypothetical protein
VAEIYTVVRVSDGVVVGASARTFYAAIGDAQAVYNDAELATLRVQLPFVKTDYNGYEHSGYRLETRAGDVAGVSEEFVTGRELIETQRLRMLKYEDNCRIEAKTCDIDWYKKSLMRTADTHRKEADALQAVLAALPPIAARQVP